MAFQEDGEGNHPLTSDANAKRPILPFTSDTPDNKPTRLSRWQMNYHLDVLFTLFCYSMGTPLRNYPRTAAYEQSLDHSVPRAPHYTLHPERAVLSRGGTSYDRKGSDRRIEDGESVLNNRVNGAHLPFPSSTSHPPTTTFPSQSASSYSNFPSSRAEEGRTDRETQTFPNAAFEIPFACAVAGKAIVLDPDGT